MPASGDLKDLPTSFYLNGLIDVLAIKECNTSEVRCGNCDKKSSEICYCFQCCLFWCRECKTAHDVIRSNRGHRVLAIKEFQDKDYEDVLKRPVFCQKQLHREKKLEFFCKECETALCQTCITLSHASHAGHTLVLIEEEAENLKPEVKILIETQRHQLQAKKTLISEFDEDYAKMLQESEDMVKNIEKFADSLIAVIEAKKQSALLILENRTKKALDYITAQKTEITYQIMAIKSSLEKADMLFMRSTDSEILQLKKSLETTFEIANQTEPIEHEPKGHPFLLFVENQKMFDNVNMEEMGFFEEPQQTKASQSVGEGIGLTKACARHEAKFTVTTRDAVGRQCYSGSDCITVDLIRDDQGEGCETVVTVNDNKDGNYEVCYFPKDHGQCKLSVKVNGQHIHGSPFAVKVKPFEFRLLESVGQQDLRLGSFTPWGLAVNDQDEIAVSDHRTFNILSVNGNNQQSAISRIKSHHSNFLFDEKKGLKCVTGIAFGKNGNIYVADSSRDRIQIFDRECEYVGEFAEEGSSDSQLSRPLGLSVNSEGNVIVADAGNKLVKIFSPDGQFLMKIGEQGCFSEPWHCIQYGEYLVVSDNLDGCVKVFDLNGNFLYNIEKLGSGSETLKSPKCLSVNKFGQLMVCAGRMYLFELNGNWVGKFSECGMFPSSAVVLSSGQIVVSGNNRIYLWQ